MTPKLINYLPAEVVKCNSRSGRPQQLKQVDVCRRRSRRRRCCCCCCCDIFSVVAFAEQTNGMKLILWSGKRTKVQLKRKKINHFSSCCRSITITSLLVVVAMSFVCLPNYTRRRRRRRPGRRQLQRQQWPTITTILWPRLRNLGVKRNKEENKLLLLLLFAGSLELRSPEHSIECAQLGG